MAKVDSAFEYYVANYGGNVVSRYDSHKKSDLRKVYNRIVKTNKESPLYKISDADLAKKFAIDIKESAKYLQNAVASLSDDYGSFENAFQKKVAYSSDEDKVTVDYVGDGSEDNPTEKFEIQVDQLARPQVNTGQYLNDFILSFVPGAYSFDLDTLNSSYEFQFTVGNDESNLDILYKLSNLVNTSNLGITAQVLSDGHGSSALSLTSKQTGLSEQEEYLFSISPSGSAGSVAAMDILRINNISSPAANSLFTLNGTAHSSLSNTFTINNAFELSLKGINTEGATTIGFKANIDAIADNIQTLTDAYNNMIQLAQDYSSTDASDGNKFRNDILSVAASRKEALANIGLILGRDGRIRIDKEVLSEAITPDRAVETFEELSQFKDILGNKADEITVDPMNYVNKVVVAYKNPGHNFNTPYITSIYSGLMLDNYA